MQAHDFARLVDAHAAALVLYARQWSAAPEDVVQDALLKLVALREPPRETMAWLYRVVRNGAIDSARSARRRQRREAVAARPVHWFRESAIEGLDAAVAVAALQRLGEEEREAITLRLWGGLNFEQIADVASCSVSTAFRRYSSGIDHLRQELRISCPTL